MDNQTNKNIECSVTNCANHCPNENYCALKKITVGSHCCDPSHGKESKLAATDCRSFVER